MQKSDIVPDLSIEKLVARIHAAPAQCVLVVTGGGSGAIAELLSVPGASRTLLQAIVPYSSSALKELVGPLAERACSPEAARAMAMAGFEMARRFAGEAAVELAGVAATASLASERPKRGPHRVHVALQTPTLTESWFLDLDKGARTRLAEEKLCTRLVMNAVAQASSLAERTAVAMNPDESLAVESQLAGAGWSELLLGHRPSVPTGSAVEGTCPEIVFPGAFDPWHTGHATMAEVAQRLLGRQVHYELSIRNVDKPSLDFLVLARRIDQFHERPLWLTRAATFVEKSQLFPQATFVVGADTVVRIADPKYYGGNGLQVARAIERIAEQGCRFLVFGRRVDGHFRTLPDLGLPGPLKDLCEGVPEAEFRADISSTAIRRTGG